MDDHRDDLADLRRYLERGDLRAFDALVDRHQSDCLRLARALLRDEHGAQDAVQDALLAVCEHGRRLLSQGLPRGLGPWLHTVTRNACLDRLRKRRVQPLREGAEADAPSAASPTEGLGPAIERLSPMHGAAVLLRYRDELSYREIAERLGKTVNHIGVLLHEAMVSLRQDPALRAEVFG